MKQKLVTGAAAAVAFGTLMVPMSHAATVTISGNGALSKNVVASLKVNATKVTQKSVTVANTTVVSTANSGGNDANGNIGGSNSNKTGKAKSSVGVVVTGGNNTASVASCGCDTDGSVEIKNNQALSTNIVLQGDVNLTKVKQKNVTVANTTVISTANSGGNDANGNIGGGNSNSTDNANSTVGVEVSGGSNNLNP